jgi:hypothetical protein
MAKVEYSVTTDICANPDDLGCLFALLPRPVRIWLAEKIFTHVKATESIAVVPEGTLIQIPQPFKNESGHKVVTRITRRGRGVT